MSISMMHMEYERIRREEGEEAAEEFGHAMIGGSIGLGTGAMTGAAI
jgi:L-aminopeptidase/D-esterase-like protein